MNGRHNNSCHDNDVRIIARGTRGRSNVAFASSARGPADSQLKSGENTARFYLIAIYS